MKKIGLVFAIGVACFAAAFVYSQLRGRQHAFTFTSKPLVRDSRDTSAKTAGARSNDWPQWRGPNRDGVSRATGLLKEWPVNGPALLWTAKGLGNGMSSLAIADGRILTLGQRGGDDVYLIALDAENGAEIWATPLDAQSAPNGTPTVDGEHVFAITTEGVLACAELKSGNLVWKKNFVSDFGGTPPKWGYSESPLVDGNLVVCTPGSENAVLVALDKSNGEVVWKAKEPEALRESGHEGAGYSSILLSTAAGIRQYVQLYGRGVIGVSAGDGTPLWGYNRIANSIANIPTPIVKGDYVFVSSGYGAGTALLRLEKRAVGGIGVNEVYFHGGGDMQNHHGGMVLVKDHLYFGHGQNNGFPICVELLTGEVAWGPERGAGGGSAAVVYADGRLYFRYEDSVMALIEATPEAYRLKSSFKLPTNLGKHWSHPVITHGKLYLRDQDVLLCYNIQE